MARLVAVQSDAQQWPGVRVDLQPRIPPESGKTDVGQLCQCLLSEGGGGGAGFRHTFLTSPAAPSVFSAHTRVMHTQIYFPQAEAAAGVALWV